MLIKILRSCFDKVFAQVSYSCGSHSYSLRKLARLLDILETNSEELKSIPPLCAPVIVTVVRSRLLKFLPTFLEQTLSGPGVPFMMSSRRYF